MRLFAAALLGVVVTVLVAALCVALIPVNKDNTSLQQSYKITTEGKLTWYFGSKEVLAIQSSIFQFTKGEIVTATNILGCDEVAAVVEDVTTDDAAIQCYEISTERGGSKSCLSDKVEVKDCLAMNTTNEDHVFWYGGAEMITQKWPLNEINMKRGAAFLSSDLPKRYGNVLERYFLSSNGVAVYINQDAPLYVSIDLNQGICLEASYDKSSLVGPTFLYDDGHSTKLSYTVCIGKDPKTVHQFMTRLNGGFIARPTQLPDLKMMQDPIWSTWARYKSDINQSVVETFVNEILEHNFTNSQVEIDDGYEDEYGDFTFGVNKFPDAKGMVSKLHDKGFRVTTWVTPFINLASKNYRTARSSGYLIPDTEEDSPAVIRWWNGRGSVVDFTNPSAAKWYSDYLSSVKAEYGLDSFKFDAGETTYLPKSGLNFTYRRDSNPSEFTKMYTKAAYQVGGNMMEMRSSWKTQGYNFYMRLMDKGSSWGGLRGFLTVIPTALTFSVLGYPFVLPDMIGGNAYVFGTNNDNKPSRELYIRWIELSAFLPCMQFSISPWQYDEEVTKIAQYYVTLHRTVVYEELVRASNAYIKGESTLLVSPLWFHADIGDVTALTVDDQFIVGDKFLVAPVLIQGAKSRNIYLPGSSQRWWDRMRPECEDISISGCLITGGQWILSYSVQLHQISWWERITK
ncbi:myogenesis-regulating glycosidase-like [Ciona intestinalis]